MRWLVATAIIGALAVGCSASTDQSSSGSSTVAATDSVPDQQSAADTGCVDEAGSLHATAGAWYPKSARGVLTLTGQDVTSPSAGDTKAFRDLAEHAVTSRVAGATLGDQLQLDASGTGCTTHRWVDFDVDDAQVVVTEWRVVHVADASYGVANETGFSAIDDTTLVAAGDSVRVALVVAPDGTTVRVSAYGARAKDRYSGWPTTRAPSPGAVPPGPAPTDTKTLTEIGKDVLAGILVRR
jgi:hypothetical protein